MPEDQFESSTEPGATSLRSERGERRARRTENGSGELGLDGRASPERERADLSMHEEDERRESRTRWGAGRQFKGSVGMARDLRDFINGGSSSRRGSASRRSVSCILPSVQHLYLFS